MVDNESSLSSLGRTVEDAFFLKQDKELIEQLKTMRSMNETMENLAKVSGINDHAVLQKLVELNIKPETVASLSIIPLIEVAWADGEVDAKEKAAILAGAKKAGFVGHGIDATLLGNWLSRQPVPKMLEAWTHYIAGLCGKLNNKERSALKQEIISNARAVAEASGGFMGMMSKISEREQKMLDKLAAAFKE